MMGRTVAVTGANGFLASWVVKLLLERGYNVRGTVRNPDDLDKVGHLLELPEAKERLVLYKANLLEEESFHAIFEGVEGVFHVASPVPSTTPDDLENNLLKPALKGTLTVLEAAKKSKSVKRVVVTSSVSAMFKSEAGENSGKAILDETWWSDEEYCRNFQGWYALSKTLAERAAWDFAKEKGLDVVVMNPGTMVGPILQGSVNASTLIVLKYLNGSLKEIPNRVFGFLHVKDAALAHIIGFEDPSAEGRYLLVERAIHAKELADMLRIICPNCPVPEKCEDNGPPLEANYCCDKIKKLGLVFTPSEEALRECVESFKAKKLINC
ncbi:cinnamoyl-CoA reductase [Marchantia polymorpha subsp. ruderalis]|uniref:NAD-dependent epimerase/dehydratase domain-containing protein n=2 Tax=Marchantia polymorpha TaxID=3197 RepID=A0A176WGH7_MARPO|nr:hypothetical protein AXG93_2772s1030 [Marchantia polymorpha subsp. ruderalis]PTQ28765.1 hypothetical protein MARPO_0155s0027 [Marchantia polymorpha]BBN19106.1 hypothetical protein Mp_8g07900 [Marchantia polymorpha subsp. ruderalis]|eukprot:PTQ28765.1 hypothetical protein MARPO_0155s0027 [Marchantia polymorpha]